MNIGVLLLAIVLSTPATAAGNDGLLLFYCVHAERSCKETPRDVPVSGDNAMDVARRALVAKDDFVGFTDAHDTTLQFYVEAPDSILVDMPIPRMKGSYSAHIDRARALKLIARLSPPLSRYRTTLKLKFARWQ